MDIRNWAIYKITNPMGRVYIGKSSNVKVRLSVYKNISMACHQQPLIYNSLKKHGSESHTYEIIDSFTSDSSFANSREIFWIKSYKSNLSRWRSGNGMNLSDGGEGNLGADFSKRIKRKKGFKMSEETKKKISDYNKANPSRGMLGKKHTQKAKEGMSLNKKGKPSPLKGYKHSAETVLKNKLSHIGIPNPTKGIPKWSHEDRKRIGLSKIGNTYTKGVKYSDEHCDKLSKKLSDLFGVAIMQYDSNGVLLNEYPSVRRAATKIGIGRTVILNSLKGIQSKNSSFVFKFSQP